MKSRNQFFITLTLAFLSPLVLNAASFVSNATEGEYYDGSTWNQSGALPTSGDDIYIRSNRIVNLSDGGNYTANRLILSNQGNRGTFNISNGTITFLDISTLAGAQTGDSVNAEAYLNVSGDGHVIFEQSVTTGNNTGSTSNISVSGGSLTIKDRLIMGAGSGSNSSQSNLLISGGTTNIATLLMGNRSGTSSQITLSGGNLNLTGTGEQKIGNATNASTHLEITGGNLTSVGHLYIGARIGTAAVTNATFNMSGGSLTMDQSGSFLVGSSQATHDITAEATITGGTVRANIIVGGVGAGYGKLIIGPNADIGTNRENTTAFELRSTGILEFKLGNTIDFNVMDYSNAKIEMGAGSQLRLDCSDFNQDLRGEGAVTFDLMQGNDNSAVNATVSFTAYGYDEDVYDFDFFWNNTLKKLQVTVTDLRAIPEPATYAMIMALGTMLFAIRRHRRH